uniref:histidinol-phosphate transaminase n=1 Tax=Thermofilum pendens TaxID=2269 RepID=A0A7C4F7T4_THEPE
MRLRLHMNESPYPPPPLVSELVGRYADLLNLYEVEELEEQLLDKLSAYAGVERENIDLYAGSSEALLVALVLAKALGLEIVVTRPTFFLVHELAESVGVRLVPVQLRGHEFSLEGEELLRAAKGRLVYLASPNNPTGNIILSDEDLLARLAKRARMVFLDEAYYEFSGVTFKDAAVELENVVVLRSLSKAFCLAGARVGYTVSSAHAKKLLARFRPGYEVSVLSQAAALAALESMDYVRSVVRRIVEAREWLREELVERGLQALKSSTNFLLVRLGQPCESVGRALEERGVLVMCPGEWFKELSHYVRVTVGRREDMVFFLGALDDALRGKA